MTPCHVLQDIGAIGPSLNVNVPLHKHEGLITEHVEGKSRRQECSIEAELHTGLHILAVEFLANLYNTTPSS